jgi:hypothetical protein
MPWRSPNRPRSDQCVWRASRPIVDSKRWRSAGVPVLPALGLLGLHPEGQLPGTDSNRRSRPVPVGRGNRIEGSRADLGTRSAFVLSLCRMSPGRFFSFLHRVKRLVLRAVLRVSRWIRCLLGTLGMIDPPRYRARLRFRVLKKLDIDAREHRFPVAGREAILEPGMPDRAIRDSEWLIINARDFSTEEEARQFARRLRAALEISAVATRLGIDAGRRDLPTSGLGEAYRRRIKEQTGMSVRDNIHGIDVFVDDPSIGFFNIQGTGTVRANPELFLRDLDALHGAAVGLSPRAHDILLLLNSALMQPDPVAQIVFAFSAVEMLGQEETWSANQKSLLEQMAVAAESASTGSPDERHEVAEAIRKLHRLTLRQGVVRMLDHLRLSHLKGDWDRLYSERSTLVHGLAPQPGADYGDLARRTMSLCGRILLKRIASEVPLANQHVETYYS